MTDFENLTIRKEAAKKVMDEMAQRLQEVKKNLIEHHGLEQRDVNALSELIRAYLDLQSATSEYLSSPWPPSVELEPKKSFLKKLFIRK